MNFVLYRHLHRHLRLHLVWLIFCVCAALPLSSGAAQSHDLSAPGMTPAPLRFLLTFDDGPSASEYDNPTEKILKVLKTNPYQADIKAIFFTQTQAKGAGGSEHGRALLKRMLESGHELAFHTATSGHANHRYLSDEELKSSLTLGVNDLNAVRGSPPQFVRPPFWSYNEQTLAAYQTHGMQMLLTDLSANDGVIYVFNFSFTKRKNMRKMLAALRPAWQAGQLPSADGVTPIIVTFHDINRYTAGHMEEYLDILLDVAKELEMPVSATPFYTDHDELVRAASLRSVKDMNAQQDLPGIWSWFWRWF